MIAPLALLAALAAPAASPAPVPRAADEAADELAEQLAELEVRWRGKLLSLEELGAEAGQAPADAARAWAPWVVPHEYRLELNDDGRVLLVLPEHKKKARKELELVAEVCERFDALLPLPVGGPTTGSRAADAARDVETAVVLQVTDVDDYSSVLDFLAQHHAYLAGWTREARGLAGFVLREPLCAAWIERLSGQEEWDPLNELVNRTAQLLVLRRFGAQPFWLEMGLAWYFEYEILDAIYCYPYRDEFVWATEHTAWEGDLRRRFEARKDEPLAMRELADWTRGKFENDPAQLAWGTVRFLARHHPEELPKLLEGLRRVILEKGRITTKAGDFTSWVLIPGFEPHPDDQVAVLRELVADDVLVRLSEFYRKGKRYKPLE